MARYHSSWNQFQSLFQVVVDLLSFAFEFSETQIIRKFNILLYFAIYSVNTTFVDYCNEINILILSTKSYFGEMESARRITKISFILAVTSLQ